MLTYKYPIDNWRRDLISLAPYGNVLLPKSSDIPPDIFPILTKMVEAYDLLANSFASTGNNYRSAPIYENEHFMTGIGFREKILKAFFGAENYNNILSAIRNLTFEKCFNNGTFKSMPELDRWALI